VAEPKLVKIPERVRELLEGKSRAIGHVCTVRKDGRLSVNPVAVVLDGDELWLSTTKDRVKYGNLLRDPRIAISVVDPQDISRYVEIRGRAELFDDVGRRYIDRIAQLYMGKEHYDLDPPTAQRVVVRILPEQVSAPWVPKVD
jgi:PPOX class probable F420-dependent enzyme